MMDTYFPQYHAFIDTDTLRVRFHRLFTDARDAMCDSPKPQWEALDQFLIVVCEVVTTRFRDTLEDGSVLTRNDVTQVDELTIETNSKQVANYIWYLAKHGTDFDTIKAMHHSKKFK